MPRFNILGFQYFTNDNEVLAGGKINFYQPGTTTRKDTFSDAALTIANTNPVTLSADGRAPNIFFSGSAKAVLTDADGVIIETLDPVGEPGDLSFSTWDGEQTYPKDIVVVGSDGYFYVSLINNNFANDPTISPSEWKLLTEFIGFESANNGYLWSVDNTQDQKVKAVSVQSINTLVPLFTTEASNVATVDITGITGFDRYIIVLNSVVPVSNAVTLSMRTSSNNGSSFDSSGYTAHSLAAFTDTSANVGGSEINLTHSLGTVSSTTAGAGVNCVINCFDFGLARFSRIMFDTVFELSSSANTERVVGGGNRAANSITNAVRFFFSGGNIASGTFTLYGVRKS